MTRLPDEGCPTSPELVTLLGEPGGAALHRHLGECAACQAELALLQQGFTALGKDEPGREGQAADELALQRIAARVMPGILADLAATSRPATAVPAPPQPVPPPLPGRQRLLWTGVLAALATAPAVLYWTQAGDALRQPALALGLVLLPLALLPALAGSVRQRGAALLLALALAVGLTLAAVPGVEVELLRGTGCLMLALSGSLLPALVIRRALGPARPGVLSGALLGAAMGSGGAALQRLSCGIGGLPHALVFHLGPFFLLIALFGLLGLRVSRLARPPSARAA